MPSFNQTAQQFNHKLQFSKIITDLQAQGSTKKALLVNVDNSEYMEANA